MPSAARLDIFIFFRAEPADAAAPFLADPLPVDIRRHRPDRKAVLKRPVRKFMKLIWLPLFPAGNHQRRARSTSFDLTSAKSAGAH